MYYHVLRLAFSRVSNSKGIRYTHMFVKSTMPFLYCIIIACTSNSIAPESTEGLKVRNEISSVVRSSNSFVIKGFKFGERGNVAPVCWDNIEDGNSDLNATIGKWNSVANLKASSQKQRSNNSKYNASSNFDGKSSNAYFTGNNAILGTKWFCQYWFMVDSNWDWGSTSYGGADKYLSNVKIFRLWNPGSAKENVVTATQGWVNSITIESSNTSQKSRGYEKGFKDEWTKGVWHGLQFQYSENTTLGAKDGTIKIWRDGRLVFSMDTLLTREVSPVLKRPYILGFYNSWSATEGAQPDTEGVQAPNDFYIDDVYTDTTWSRVEIGDSPEYETCTHREIQIPVAWADTAITVSVNKGSFNTGDKVYVFVVDEDGNPSRGFEMKMK